MERPNHPTAVSACKVLREVVEPARTIGLHQAPTVPEDRLQKTASRQPTLAADTTAHLEQHTRRIGIIFGSTLIELS